MCLQESGDIGTHTSKTSAEIGKHYDTDFNNYFGCNMGYRYINYIIFCANYILLRHGYPSMFGIVKGSYLYIINSIGDARTPQPGEIVFNTLRYRSSAIVQTSGNFQNTVSQRAK